MRKKPRNQLQLASNLTKLPPGTQGEERETGVGKGGEAGSRGKRGTLKRRCPSPLTGIHPRQQWPGSHHINNPSEVGKGGAAPLLFALLLVHLLHFHPPVLKPDFDLSLTQIEESGHFVPAVPGEVHIEQKLLL